MEQAKKKKKAEQPEQPQPAQPQQPPNPFDEFLATYTHEPVRFVREVLGVPPDKWQAEFLTAIARGHRRISVRSGHGVGKSTAAAWAMLWWLITRYPLKIVVTAPTSSQLYDALFAEVKRWVKELPKILSELIEVKQDRLELKASPTESFISARTSRAEQPEALAGVHSEHVMLIADEASGVPEQVFEAAAGSMSGHSAVTILLGNPVRSSGLFHDTHHRLKDKWWTLRVSCADSPRVSKAYIEEMKARYGEDSNAYRVRVLGEFPRGDDDTIIPIELVDAARERDVAEEKFAPLVWGLDVARFGSDSSALCKRKGNTVIEPIRLWRNLDLMQLTGAVKAEYDALLPSERPTEILVDSIGLGAGVVDRLRELKLPARGINVSESPALGHTYRNLRAELWHRAKAWLERRDCRMPRDERLANELVSVRYTFTSGGKIQVESKDDMRRRGLHSPDAADAFVLTFASDAATALYGVSVSGGWASQIRRSVKGVV